MLLSNVAFEDHPAISEVRQREHERFRAIEQEHLNDWNNRAIFNRRSRAILLSLLIVAAFVALAYPIWKQQGSLAIRIAFAVTGTLGLVFLVFKRHGTKPIGDMHPWRSCLADSAMEILRAYAELALSAGIDAELTSLLPKKADCVTRVLFEKYIDGYETPNYTAFDFSAEFRGRLSAPAHPEETVLWELIQDSRPLETGSSNRPAPYSSRARWLKDRLLERGWSSGTRTGFADRTGKL